MRDVSPPIQLPSSTLPSSGSAQSEGPILVTGAAGFIGASVTRELLLAGQRVIALDDLSAGFRQRLVGLPGPGSVRLEVGDVRDGALLDRLLSERPAVVLHLAARVGVRTVLGDPEGCELENLEGARALRAALDRAALDRKGRSGWSPPVIAASTSEIYAESATPLREDSPLRPRAAQGRWRYAASKRIAEEILDGSGGQGRAMHLRFFNVVGPGQDASSGMVLPRFVEAARAGQAIEVYGTGEQVRTFAHVDAVARDVAALVLQAKGGTFTPGPLNVGGTARATVLELGRLIASTFVSESPAERAPELVFRDPKRAVSIQFEEVLTRTPDLSRLRSLGLGGGAWALADIVRDALIHHESFAAPSPAPSPAPTPTPTPGVAREEQGRAHPGHHANPGQAGAELCASRAS